MASYSVKIFQVYAVEADDKSDAEKKAEDLMNSTLLDFTKWPDWLSDIQDGGYDAEENE